MILLDRDIGAPVASKCDPRQRHCDNSGDRDREAEPSDPWLVRQKARFQRAERHMVVQQDHEASARDSALAEFRGLGLLMDSTPPEQRSNDPESEADQPRGVNAGYRIGHTD